MINKKPSIQSYIVIGITVLFAFFLSLLPLPEWALWWRPAWVAMVLIYWVMALPERVNLLYAWCVGLFADAIYGTALGLHALLFCLLAFITTRCHRQIRVFPLWQQAVVVAVLILLLQSLLAIFASVLQAASVRWFYLPALSSGILWPWLFVILRDCRRRFKVA